MSSDLFSDILQLADATSVLSGGLAAGGTWAFRFRSQGKIKFYVVAEGSCWLRIEGERKPMRLGQGDVVLLCSSSSSFIVGGSPTAAARDACPVFEQGGTFAGIGPRSDCVLLVGVVSLHPSSAEMFTSALPSVVHVRAIAPDAAAMRWLVERIAHEQRASLPGARTISVQLAQVLFMQVLRAHLAGPGRVPPGWLRAIRDERLVPALRLMHDAPGRAWTVADLSKGAGMSRARFAVHFKSAAGVAPLTYLTELRMRVAQKMLREKRSPIADIATSIGYQSQSAFSHAFRRVIGSGPQAYRIAEARRASSSTHAATRIAAENGKPTARPT